MKVGLEPVGSPAKIASEWWLRKLTPFWAAEKVSRPMMTGVVQIP